MSRSLIPSLLGVLAFCTFLGFSVPAYATMGWWGVGGMAGATPPENVNGARNSYYTTSSTGQIYAAFIDASNGSRLTVKVLNGQTWDTVGTAGFSTGTIYTPTIRIAPNGTPYVAYQDVISGNGFFAVRKFDGAAWVDVSSSIFSSIPSDNASTFYDFAISPDGTPYLALVYKPYNASNVGKLAVFKYTGSTWTPISGAYDINGNAGTTFYTNGMVFSPKLAFTSDGTMYMSYEDYGDNGVNGGTIKLVKYVSGSLVYLGSPDQGISNYDDWSALAIGPDDSIYVAYGESANGGKGVVKKWTGSGWTTLGNTYLGVSAYLLDLLVDKNNQVYFVFCDSGNSYKSFVYRFDGTSWSYINRMSFGSYALLFMDPVSGTIYGRKVSSAVNGVSGVGIVAYSDLPTTGSSLGATAFNGSGTGATGTRPIAFDSVGNAYVAYVDYSAGRNTTVMKYSGSSWDLVGSAGAVPTATGSSAFAPYLAIAPDDTPYVLFRDGSNATVGGKASVMKWNGSAWVYVGAAGLSSGQAAPNQLAFSASGAPYVVYKDVTTGYIAMRYFDGTAWQNVGSSETITSYTGNLPYLAFAPNGDLYITFSDISVSTGRGPTVMKWNGSVWSQVGSARIGTYSTNGNAYTPSGIVVGLDGTPYLMAVKMSAAGEFPRLYLWKFNGTDWVTVGSYIGNFTPTARLYISRAGTLFVSYLDATEYMLDINTNTGFYPITTMRFSGTDWVPVGASPYVATNSSWGDVNPVDNLPYLAMMDTNYKISVLSPLLKLVNSTSISASLVAGAVSILTPSSIAFPSASASNTSQNLALSGGTFAVEDLKGATNGWYATLSASDLSDGNGHTISRNSIFAHVAWGSVSTVAGNANAAVNVPTWAGTIGAGYASLGSAITFMQRSTTGGIIGRYGVSPDLRITLPAYAAAGNYTGTFTFTLIEN